MNLKCKRCGNAEWWRAAPGSEPGAPMEIWCRTCDPLLGGKKSDREPAGE